jgi:hypothetical protein
LVGFYLDAPPYIDGSVRLFDMTTGVTSVLTELQMPNITARPDYAYVGAGDGEHAALFNHGWLTEFDMYALWIANPASSLGATWNSTGVANCTSDLGTTGTTTATTTAVSAPTTTTGLTTGALAAVSSGIPIGGFPLSLLAVVVVFFAIVWQ